MKKEIVLDEAAQNLFKALGGIDTSARVIASGRDGGDLSFALGATPSMPDWNG